MRPVGDDIGNPIAQSGCQYRDFRLGPSHARQLHLFARQPHPPIMIVDGTDDPLYPYKGGEQSIFGFRKKGTLVSAPATAEAFARRNGIVARPNEEILPHRDPRDPTSVQRLTWWKQGKLMSFSIPSARRRTHGAAARIPLSARVERTPASRAEVVNCARDQLLAGACLSLDKNGGIRRRHAFDLFNHRSRAGLLLMIYSNLRRFCTWSPNSDLPKASTENLLPVAIRVPCRV
jgi:hypothetical protein